MNDKTKCFIFTFKKKALHFIKEKKKKKIYVLNYTEIRLIIWKICCSKMLIKSALDVENCALLMHCEKLYLLNRTTFSIFFQNI